MREVRLDGVADAEAFTSAFNAEWAVLMADFAAPPIDLLLAPLRIVLPQGAGGAEAGAAAARAVRRASLLALGREPEP